jgi:hypothetical protein
MAGGGSSFLRKIIWMAHVTAAGCGCFGLHYLDVANSFGIPWNE